MAGAPLASWPARLAAVKAHLALSCLTVSYCRVDEGLGKALQADLPRIVGCLLSLSGQPRNPSSTLRPTGTCPIWRSGFFLPLSGFKTHTKFLGSVLLFFCRVIHKHLCGFGFELKGMGLGSHGTKNWVCSCQRVAL